MAADDAMEASHDQKSSRIGCCSRRGYCRLQRWQPERVAGCAGNAAIESILAESIGSGVGAAIDRV